MTEITDLSTTDSANTAIGAESLEGNIANMGRMDDTLQAVMGLLARSIRTNVLRFLDNTDPTKKLAYDLSGLTTATTRTQIAPDENGRQALQPHLAGHLYGLTLSNNATDATNDIDITAGNAIDSGNVHVMTLASALTKRLDAAWAVGTGNGGLDTGSIANTTYHVWLIKRSDTGVVDALFSTSASAPTMPANYDLKRRIGSVVRTGAAIKAFTQDGDYFEWKTLAADVSAVNPGSSAVTRTLTVPIGIRVMAKVHATITGTDALLLTDLSSTDEAANGGTAMMGGITAPSGSYLVMTNTSGQIRSRLNGGGSSTLGVQTRGWFDTRGRV